nr:V1 [Grapevine geminivirus A defective DNA]
MDFNPRKRKSFAPLTPAQLARQRRWRALVAQGAKRRLTYPSLYRPQLMNVRRSSQSIYPDKGYHDDEDHWEGFTMSEGKATYVSMPHLGQGASQRHTSKIKLWSISVRGSLHVLSCTNPETISAQVILVWAHRPGPAGAFSLNSLGNAVDPNPLSHTQSHNSSGTLLKLSNENGGVYSLGGVLKMRPKFPTKW